jgi:hypothetical protein
MYVPISYYTDLWLYRRRLRNKARQAEKAKLATAGKGSLKEKAGQGEKASL